MNKLSQVVVVPTGRGSCRRGSCREWWLASIRPRVQTDVHERVQGQVLFGLHGEGQQIDAPGGNALQFEALTELRSGGRTCKALVLENETGFGNGQQDFGPGLRHSSRVRKTRDRYLTTHSDHFVRDLGEIVERPERHVSILQTRSWRGRRRIDVRRVAQETVGQPDERLRKTLSTGSNSYKDDAVCEIQITCVVSSGSQWTSVMR